MLPVYLGFMLLAPLMGALAARLCRLPLPLALALPEDIRGLAAAAVITQTLVELVGELIYIRVIPALVWRKRSGDSLS